MQCHECQHEQDGGRFCGRCGALVVVDPEVAGRSAVDAEDTTDADPPPLPSRVPPVERRRRGSTMAVASGVVLAAVVLTALFAQPGTMPAEDTPEEARDLAREDPGSQAVEVEVEVWPVAFPQASGITLVFDDGEQGTVAVDLDTGEQTPVALPQRAGDRPYRIWRLGDDHVAVAGSVVAADMVGQLGSEWQLPDAAFFVPAAEPDQLWLIGDAAGAADQSSELTARLIDLDGSQLAAIEVDATGVEVLRGVPGGLAVQTGDGALHAYDLDGRLHRDFLGETAVHLLDANAEQVLWCDDACGRLQLTDGLAALEGFSVTGGVGGVHETPSFDPSASWLSPDGLHIVAVAMVELEDGSVDRVLRVYGQSGSPITSTRVPLGEVRGVWSPDARQLLFTISTPPGSGGPQIMGQWRAGSGFRTFDVKPHLDGLGQFIALDTEDLPSPL